MNPPPPRQEDPKLKVDGPAAFKLQYCIMLGSLK